MFSIYIPHVTEEIYQNTFKDTVHTESINNTQFAKLSVLSDKDLIRKGEEACNVVSQVRGYKTDNKVSLKTELTTLKVTSPYDEFLTLCADDIKDATNAHEVVISHGDNLSVEVLGVVESNQ